jgi:hypothetical protein
MSDAGKHEKDAVQHGHGQHGYAKESLVAEKMPRPVTADVEVVETSEGPELLFAEDASLSPAQNRTTQQMLRLYGSLCGQRPGEYWPQALLDTAGTFNRPPFPRQNGGR